MLAPQKQQPFRIRELDGSIQALLNNKEYEHAAEKLFEAHQLATRQGATGLANVLLAAYQICLTCHQQQQNVLMVHGVYEQAVNQEADFRQQLDSLLETCVRGETAVSTPTKLHPSTDPSLWQRVKKQVRSWGKKQGGTTQNRPITVEMPSIPETTPPVQSPPITPPPSSSPIIESPHPTLTVYCLGSFRVYEDNHPINDWSNGKGKSIFKYLIMHRHQPIHKELLMDLFWPNAEQDAARNNLNVAIYGLRKALRNGYPDFSHILFQQDCYQLNPDLQIWTDIEAFDNHIQSAQDLEKLNQESLAIAAYHAAEELYQGDLLMEDRYEEWILSERQHRQDTYLKLLNRLSDYYFDNQNLTTCVTLCHKILAIEPCREETHRQLMHIYCHQQQHYLAIRQYYQCVETLKEDLDVPPAPKTVKLFEKIRHREPI